MNGLQNVVKLQQIEYENIFDFVSCWYPDAAYTALQGKRTHLFKKNYYGVF